MGDITGGLLLGDSEDLLDRCDPIYDLLCAILPNSKHSSFHSSAFYGVGVRGLQNDILDGIIQQHEFKDALPSLITRVKTRRATFATVYMLPI